MHSIEKTAVDNLKICSFYGNITGYYEDDDMFLQIVLDKETGKFTMYYPEHKELPEIFIENYPYSDMKDVITLLARTEDSVLEWFFN